MANAWIIVADDMSAASVAGLAEKTGMAVDAIVLGDEQRAQGVAAYGVASVVRYDTTGTLAEAFAPAIAERAANEAPAVVACSDNASARAIAGAVAVKLGAAVATSVVGVKVEGDTAVVEQLVAEGEAVQVLKTTKPAVCVVADGGEEAAVADIAPIADAQDAADTSITVVSTDAEAGGASGLLTAERVVGVGLGIGEKDNLQLIYDLADVIGAEVACTLPLCDNYHWFEHNRVVGTSTQKISPRLYLSFGSSGAPQHMMGVRSAKVIVAVNNDPEAPIFRECAYGVIGDAKKVLPALIEELKRA